MYACNQYQSGECNIELNLLYLLNHHELKPKTSKDRERKWYTVFCVIRDDRVTLPALTLN